MKKLVVAVLSGLLLTSLLATQVGASGWGWGKKNLPATVVDVAVEASGTPNEFDSNGGDFDILVAAVLALGLDDALTADGQRTVFAPTDQAFMDLVEELTGTAPASEADAFAAVAGVDGVTDIVTYHVSPYRIPAFFVFFLKNIPTLNGETLTKDRFSLSLDAGDLGAGERHADIVVRNLRAKNGIVHAIDTVLIP